MQELISVIVTTYNREDALGAVLRALSRQSDRNFELIIADDGSRGETAQTVAAWKTSAPFKVVHVWHEDRGFRAAEIRNRALLTSQGAYCVFLDGDCIPRPGFVTAHRRLAENGWFVSGNRVLISEELTARIFREGAQPETWSWLVWVKERLRGGVNRLLPLFSLSLAPLRKMRPSAWQSARSCNLGVWRADLDKVDGFDAAYRGWGREDSDLLVRLLRAGVRRKDGNFATGVLHLWHPEADRSALPRNDQYLEQSVNADRVRATEGLSGLAGARAEKAGSA